MHAAALSFQAMGTACAVRLYAPSPARAEEACALAAEEVARLEQKYSRYRDDSVTARINASAGDTRGIEVDEETAALLDYAATAHAQSQGRFDITSGVLRRAWDFRAARVPAQAEIDALLPLVGWDRVAWERPRLVLPRAGMQVDFGGVVKEYAADAAALQALSAGVRHGLCDLGGDIRVLGPHPDGRPWRVGIRDPLAPARAIATLPIAQGAIATSGDYERAFVAGGRRYGHVLDPKTGWPVESYASVSVLAPQCLVAGTATTTALALGRGPGGDWLAALGLPHLCVGQDRRLSGSLAPDAANAGFS